MADDDTEYDLPVRHDLRVTEAKNFTLYIGTPELQSKVLHGPLKTFQGNVERVHQLSTIPQSATVSTTQHLLMLCQATFNVLRKPVMDDAEVKVHQSAISNEYARIAHAHTRSDGFFSDKKEMVRIFVDDALNYHKYESIQYWQWEGHYALLASQIIGAWTALDALTSDLWVALVNERPGVLYNMQKKKIQVKHLLEARKHGVASDLGNLLRQRIRFENFTVTKKIFRSTFRDAKAIYTPLESPVISLCCRVRNSLVHNAGTANQTFVEAAKKLKIHPWNTVARNKTLPLDGSNVATLCSAIVSCGNEILLAADRWLRPPAPTPPAQAP